MTAVDIVKRVMETTAGTEYWALAKCEDRELELYRSQIESRVDWFIAEFRWFLGLEPKPDMVLWIREGRL